MLLPNSGIAALEILTRPQNLLWLHLLVCEKAGVIYHCDYEGRGIMGAGDALSFLSRQWDPPPALQILSTEGAGSFG